MDLDNVLSDKPAPPVVIDKVPEAMDEKPETDALPQTEAFKEPAATPSVAKDEPAPTKVDEPAVVRDEKGRFTKSEPTVPVAALQEERRKRQEAEERLRQAEPQKPKTSVFEDEDKAILERVDAQLLPWKDRFFKFSVKAAKVGRDDYDAIAQVFSEAAAQDPRLATQLRDHDDPGEFIYSVGKQLHELGDVGGDITKYREKVESEWKGKFGELETRLKALEAENKALKESRDRQSKIPQSLNSEQSASPKDGVFAGPSPLKSILS